MQNKVVDKARVVDDLLGALDEAIADYVETCVELNQAHMAAAKKKQQENAWPNSSKRPAPHPVYSEAMRHVRAASAGWKMIQKVFQLWPNLTAPAVASYHEEKREVEG